MSDESNATSLAVRPASFARHARVALEKHLPQAGEATAHWHLGTNEAWVRLARSDGWHEYFGLRRHLDWVTGEAGLSRLPADLADLVPLPGPPTAAVSGFRIRLGDLLHGDDRWWAVGENEDELVKRLDDLALQLAVRGGASLRRWPGVGG